MPPERRLAAILSADVAGYSRLMAEDEDATVQRVTAYREEVELLVHQHGGQLVDFTGDNFLAEFRSAVCGDQVGRELRTDARVCSGACRWRAYRARRKSLVERTSERLTQREISS